MKTNITMESVKDRELFGVVIRQETKTGFMSLTDLQEAYIHARVLNGWSDKHLTEVFRDTDNIERIYYVLNEQGFIKSQFSEFMEMVEEDGIIKVLKQAGAYRTTGRGENKRVMCNPYVWVLVAMELNPQLYAKVVTWLTDKLIINRIEAGNFYKTLSGALARISAAWECVSCEQTRHNRHFDLLAIIVSALIALRIFGDDRVIQVRQYPLPVALRSAGVEVPMFRHRLDGLNPVFLGPTLRVRYPLVAQ